MFIPKYSIKIHYFVDDLKKCYIETNMRPEALAEMLSIWIHSQVGTGVDKRTPNSKDDYTILIEVDRNDVDFYTVSDAGNNQLTTGIIATIILPHLDCIKLCELV